MKPVVFAWTLTAHDSLCVCGGGGGGKGDRLIYVETRSAHQGSPAKTTDGAYSDRHNQLQC